METDDRTEDRAEDKDVRWRVIAAELRAAILDGRYPPGGPLPSEPELTRKHGVSRPTVRKAIDTLVTEGLIYVMRGRGSFVRPAPEREVILITNQDRPDLACPAYHPEIRPFGKVGWETFHRDAKREGGSLPYDDGKIAANRDIAIMLGVRNGHPVIHRHATWSQGYSPRFEINSYTNADLVPDWDDQKRYHQYRKRIKFFYEQLQRDRGPVRWVTLTTARIAYEDERTTLGMDYAEAILIIRRTMTDDQGHPLEVTEVKAAANRYEIAHGAEIADDPNGLFTPEELAEEGIALVI
ncbi:GntR family transcriptional regulator [Sphaerisporangium album]|uniref:GntR family transcriptional regulator n=1 Tax=Sphaerisporangium album TaxID=509200 RepID=A0A367FF09_9ACTN|nr:GntR family transcriptional regulator [Sphaerisporangium album]RCG28973.1 GntR family transcriptional regulator [Sphaerisporangium album]